MKFFIFTILLIFYSKILYSQNLGSTQITAEDGIEVFQKEKYYLLKNNVEIISDNLNLKADLVKAYFDKDLYDIIKIYSEGNVILKSNQKKIDAQGNILRFSIKDEKIRIEGKNSKLNLDKSFMFSDGIIEVSNFEGTFYLEGKNSKLKNDNILVVGTYINGKFTTNKEVNEIIELYVKDEKLSNIKTDKIDMYSKKGVYNMEKNFIELTDNVKVIRGSEIITGDVGYVDIKNNSYKVSSNKANKVKVLLNQNDE